VDQRCHAERAQHVGAIGGRGAVGAERDVDAGVFQFAHPRDPRAELEVRQRIVADRGAAGADKLDLVIGEPDRVVEREVLREHADPVEMLDDRPAVHELALHRLQLRLERMGVDRQAARERDLGRRLQEIVGAPLRADGSENGADAAVGSAVPPREVSLEHRELVLPGGGRQRCELGLDGGRHQLVDPRRRLEKWPVRHRCGDRGTQADIAIGRRGAVERRSFAEPVNEIVLHRGDARAHAFDREQHGAQIVRALRQRRERERGVSMENPNFKRERIPEALAEAFVGMGVRVDEAGNDDAFRRVDHARTAPGDRLGLRETGADRGDPAVVDEDIGAVEMGPVRTGHDVAIADQDGTAVAAGGQGHRSFQARA
jgi:hypothetical protein